MENIRVEIEERRQRSYALHAEVMRIASVVEKDVLSIRRNRMEFLSLIVEVAEELLNSAWDNCRPEWNECNCGLDGCGEWLPGTEAETAIGEKLFQPINRLMYHSRELIEAVGFEDSWKE